MAAPTVEQPGTPRSRALVRRIAELEPEPRRLDAVALGLVDALLEADADTLGAALDSLRDARARAGEREALRGWLDAAIAFAHWGLERVPSPSGVARGTQAYRFLSALDEAPQRGSGELRRLLGTDETQVSRTGRRLLDSGLVTRRRVGRQVFWQLSPRGRHALEHAPETEARPGADPMRQRIVEHTLRLHNSKGIRATTWQDISASAGVPVESLQAMFPTQADLVRACGQHFVETLQLPAADRAAEIFAGASSEPERIRRLVETLFAIYERGADGIVVARREQADVPAVRESIGKVEKSLDALVTEAVRSRRPDSSSVTSLRALTDVEIWRTLRDQGATPDSAVAQTSVAVERWLAEHPARGSRG